MLQGLSARTTFMVAASVASAALSGCGDADEYLMPRQCAVPISDSPARGPEDALVTIVEFADFECPYCGRVQPTLDKLDELYQGELRWVFKHLPFAMHPYAYDSAIAAECARDQDRFWEMAEALFEQQASLSSTLFSAIAASLELDMDAWQDCFDSEAPEGRILSDVKLAIEYEVRATPTFIVNGFPVLGAQPLSVFRSAVDEAFSEARKSGEGGAEYYAALVDQGCQ